MELSILKNANKQKSYQQKRYKKKLTMKTEVACSRNTEIRESIPQKSKYGIQDDNRECWIEFSYL